MSIVPLMISKTYSAYYIDVSGLQFKRPVERTRVTQPSTSEKRQLLQNPIQSKRQSGKKKTIALAIVPLVESVI